MNEQVFKLGKLFLYIGALGQLALSQIHIGIITKVFDTSIGFFLFLFVIFTLVTAFNGSAINKDTSGFKIIFSILGFALAVAMGFVYLGILRADVATGKLLTTAEAMPSIVFTLVTMVLCGASLAVIILARKYDE